jgi:hypothetical protein
MAILRLEDSEIRYPETNFQQAILSHQHKPSRNYQRKDKLRCRKLRASNKARILKYLFERDVKLTHVATDIYKIVPMKLKVLWFYHLLHMLSTSPIIYI